MITKNRLLTCLLSTLLVFTVQAQTSQDEAPEAPDIDAEALEIVKELRREHLKRKANPPKDREEGSAKVQPIPEKYIWFWRMVLVLILAFLFLVFIGFLRRIGDL